MCVCVCVCLTSDLGSSQQLVHILATYPIQRNNMPLYQLTIVEKFIIVEITALYYPQKQTT